ncbi:Atg6/Beclin [Chytriomyces sp. MP71]|nr:Atg6/Beclin [Chytriomyces sp. MP71]
MDPVLVNSLPAPASIPDSHPDSSSVDPRRHVLCADCAAILAERLEKKVAEARRERDAYVHYLESLSLSDQDHGYVGDHAGDEYEEDSSQEELDAALAEYTTLQRESAAIKEELAAAEAELRELDLEEEAYWRDVNKLQMQEAAIENERDSLHFRLTVATRGLERLEKTNVYNDAFRIWHDGPFGTINGFRLGRLPNQPVEWNEINAALGLSLLLVDTLASKLGFVFKGYKLVPMGSFSRIEKIDGDKAAYELYGSNDFSVLLFWNRRFDSALQAFLNCIQQLGDFVHERDPKLKLPYPIHKDKIGDLSVRVQFNQDEQWTRALKFMLVNIRFLLVCCVSQGGSK